jgi:putative ABC transport system permease protein
MNEVFRIAVRNVLRHKRRAFITAITMMVGIGIFIGMDSMMTGMDRVTINNMIDLKESSVKIFTKQYDADRSVYPLDYGIPDPAAVSRYLSTDSRVRASTNRTLFIGQVSNYRDALPVVGTVVDPQTDSKVFTLADYTEGKFFGTGKSNQIVMGKELALKLGFKLGDAVLLSARTKYDAQNADEFTIVGLLSTSDPAINQSSVFITYATADNFLDLENLVTEVDVKLVHRVNLADAERDASAVAAGVSSAFPALAPYTFKQLGQAFLDLMNQKKMWGFLIIFIILLIAAVGIVNTVLMSVYERIREVGVLKALGFTRREVVWMFTLEGVFVGVLGSALGAILGALLDLYLILEGIPLSAFGENLGASSGIAFWGTLYGEWNPGAILFAIGFGLVVAVVSAVIPARKAAKMAATTALRFV